MASYITTTDNPYNPITQFDDWYRFDEEKGYHSCGYLARKVKNSDQLGEEEQDREIDRAVDEIVAFNRVGLETGFKVNYKKIVG